MAHFGLCIGAELLHAHHLQRAAMVLGKRLRVELA
jgi:hypothetical protein